MSEHKVTERDEDEFRVIEVTHMETKLQKQERPCSGCGKVGSHIFHFISEHVHPGHQAGDIKKIDVEIDKICGCGSCLDCNGRSKNKGANDVVKDVYFQSLCDGCVINFKKVHVNDESKPTKTFGGLRFNVTYRYCILCERYLKCGECGKKWKRIDWERWQALDVILLNGIRVDIDLNAINIRKDTLNCILCNTQFTPCKHPIDYRRNQVLNELYGDRVLYDME